jgi:hypothetical protein
LPETGRRALLIGVVEHPPGDLGEFAGRGVKVSPKGNGRSRGESSQFSVETYPQCGGLRSAEASLEGDEVMHGDMHVRESVLGETGREADRELQGLQPSRRIIYSMGIGDSRSRGASLVALAGD